MPATLITMVLNYIHNHYNETGIYEFRKISEGDLARLSPNHVSHAGCPENLVCYSIVHKKYQLTVSCEMTSTTVALLKVKAFCVV